MSLLNFRLTRRAGCFMYKRILMLFPEPDFVGSYDIGQYVFFFFRETAVEYINCGKSIFSRVARVCKTDMGGKNTLPHNWVTYLKARLNCSIPGEYPFYFNEIRKYYYVQCRKTVCLIRFFFTVYHPQRTSTRPRAMTPCSTAYSPRLLQD